MSQCKLTTSFGAFQLVNGFAYVENWIKIFFTNWHLPLKAPSFVFGLLQYFPLGFPSWWDRLFDPLRAVGHLSLVRKFASSSLGSMTSLLIAAHMKHSLIKTVAPDGDTEHSPGDFPLRPSIGYVAIFHQGFTSQNWWHWMRVAAAQDQKHFPNQERSWHFKVRFPTDLPLVKTVNKDCFSWKYSTTESWLVHLTYIHHFFLVCLHEVRDGHWPYFYGLGWAGALGSNRREFKRPCPARPQPWLGPNWANPGPNRKMNKKIFIYGKK